MVLVVDKTFLTILYNLQKMHGHVLEEGWGRNTMEYKALQEHFDKIADVPGDDGHGDDHHSDKSVVQGEYEVDHGISDLVRKTVNVVV